MRSAREARRAPRPARIAAWTPVVVEAGASSNAIHGATVPGYFYLGVYFEADDADNLVDVPFELDLQIVGERAGAPAYTDTPGATDPELVLASSTTDPAAAVEEADDGLPVALLAGAGGGLLVVLLVVGLAVALRLRRRHA